MLALMAPWRMVWTGLLVFEQSDSSYLPFILAPTTGAFCFFAWSPRNNGPVGRQAEAGSDRAKDGGAVAPE